MLNLIVTSPRLYLYNMDITNTYETLNTQEYHLTLEDVEALHFPEIEPIEFTPRISTSMQADRAPIKAKDLLRNGFTLPPEWYSETADGEIIIPTEYLACIHTLFTLMTRTGVLIGIVEELRSKTIDRDTANILLTPINTWMDGRIEPVYNFRQGIEVSGFSTNVEAFFRSRGTVVNVDQHVSEDEIVQIRDIFLARFRPGSSQAVAG